MPSLVGSEMCIRDSPPHGARTCRTARHIGGPRFTTRRHRRHHSVGRRLVLERNSAHHLPRIKSMGWIGSQEYRYTALQLSDFGGTYARSHLLYRDHQVRRCDKQCTEAHLSVAAIMDSVRARASPSLRDSSCLAPTSRSEASARFAHASAASFAS